MKKLLYILLFVPLVLFGQNNYSLSFDGVDDYLEIGDLNGFNSTSSHTFIVFEKHESGIFCDGAGAFIISEPCVYGGLSSECLHYGYFSDIGNCETGDYIGVDFFADRLVFDQGFNSSEWNMWAFTYNHNTLERKIYRNGNFIVSDVSSGYNGPLDLMIGARGGGDINLDYFIGNIDDILVYNYDLSDNEIHNCLTFSPSEFGLVGYWNFNEGSGDTVYDLSGNGNHGIIHGATYSDDAPLQNCIEGCTDLLAPNFNFLATLDDGSCISQEEYVIDSLQTELITLNEEATTSLSSLQQALDTWNTTIDLISGWNMFGYGCPTPIDLVEGLSNHTDKITIVKDNNGNVYMPEFGFNGIGDLTPGYGYQIKVTEEINDFSLCDWYVNDIPENNIVSLQEEVENLNEENTYLIDSLGVINSQIGCTDSLACNYDTSHIYEDSSCIYSEEGYDCDGNINVQIGDEAFGGIVFYIDSTGQHGLVVGVEENFIGLNYNQANIMAENYSAGSFYDWYLPSLDDMYLINQGGWYSSFDFEFWSSTAVTNDIDNTNHNYTFNFMTGYPNIINIGDGYEHYAIPIRSF